MVWNFHLHHIDGWVEKNLIQSPPVEWLSLPLNIVEGVTTSLSTWVEMLNF